MHIYREVYAASKWMQVKYVCILMHKTITYGFLQKISASFGAQDGKVR